LHMRICDDGRGMDPQVLEKGRDGHWGTEVQLSIPSTIAFWSFHPVITAQNNNKDVPAASFKRPCVYDFASGARSICYRIAVLPKLTDTGRLPPGVPAAD